VRSKVLPGWTLLAPWLKRRFVPSVLTQAPAGSQGGYSPMTGEPQF
jgi:hypothetical protein